MADWEELQGKNIAAAVAADIMSESISSGSERVYNCVKRELPELLRFTILINCLLVGQKYACLCRNWPIWRI